jgi:hypothetical protein
MAVDWLLPAHHEQVFPFCIAPVDAGLYPIDGVPLRQNAGPNKLFL